MDLTAAGIADGFSLSEFVSGFANNGVGPLGMAVNSDGNVIVNDNSEVGGLNYVFKDVDGQTVAAALGTAPNPGFPPAYAFSNGSVWGSTGFSPAGGNPSGALVKLNNDGTVNTVYANIPVTNGLWTNPVSGDLLGAGADGIIDINVSGATPTFRVVTSAGSDGSRSRQTGKLSTARVSPASTSPRERWSSAPSAYPKPMEWA